MTEAFEKWFNNHFEELKATEYTNLSDAHFWLTAFVKEVFEQAKRDGLYEDFMLRKLVRDFGLDVKEKP